MAKEIFPRHESGLVDLDCYLTYLPDHPDTVPIYLVPFNESPVVHQHVYFRWFGYRSPGKTPDEGNLNPLAKFRNFSHNQILMRRTEELRLHQDFEDDVRPPPDETVSKSLEDFRRLDQLAASTIGLELTLHPECRWQYFPDSGPALASYYVPKLDIADYFDNQRELAIESLAHPKISPQRVITSAIKRLSVYLQDERLSSEADERLAADLQYYPLRMRHKQHFYDLSNFMLNQEFKVVRLPEETEIEADYVAA